MIKDILKITGKLHITLYDKNHNIKQQVEVPNLVVNDGMNLIANILAGDSTAYITHMAVGTSATAAAGSQSTLISETGRNALTGYLVTNNVIQYSATFNTGEGTGELQEAGLFNDGTAGTMLCRTVFDPINKDVDDILTINWSVTFNYA